MSVWVQGFFILILVVVGFVVGVGLLLCAGASLDREFRRRHPVLSALGIMAAVAIVLFVLFILFGMYMSIMHEVFGVV